MRILKKGILRYFKLVKVDLVFGIWKRAALLLINSVKVDLDTQHAGTVLGLIWVVLGPLLLLILYTLIYAVIFNVRVPEFTQAEYVINVFSGLVPFLAFSQALSTSAGSLSRGKALLFTSYPAEFIPAKAVISAYVIVIPSTILVLIGDFLLSEPSWYSLLVPVVIFLQMLFSIGLGFLLALLTLAIKDITLAIQYVVIALLIATPIAYTPGMVPPQLLPLFYVNPLFYFVSTFQHLILLNKPPGLDIILPGLVFTALTFFGGLWVFRRGRMALMDLV